MEKDAGCRLHDDGRVAAAVRCGGGRASWSCYRWTRSWPGGGPWAGPPLALRGTAHAQTRRQLLQAAALRRCRGMVVGCSRAGRTGKWRAPSVDVRLGATVVVPLEREIIRHNFPTHRNLSTILSVGDTYRGPHETWELSNQMKGVRRAWCPICSKRVLSSEHWFLAFSWRILLCFFFLENYCQIEGLEIEYINIFSKLNDQIIFHYELLYIKCGNNMACFFYNKSKLL